MDTFCVSGKIKVLEKTFLTADDLSKIVNAKTFSEATALLTGTIYSVPSTISSSSEIHNFFDSITLKLVEEMKKLLPEELYHYFLLPYDFHNLKLILEKYKTGSESKNYIPYSSIDYFTLNEAFEKNNFKEIPVHLKPLVEFISKNRDSENVILLSKKVFWNIAKNLIRAQHSDFIEGYIKIEIDLSNIGIFLQQHIAGLPFDINFLTEGGRIKKERYIREDTLWATVGIAYRGVKTPITADEYEIVKYNLRMNYLKNARVIPSGIETIFSYFAARQMEIDNIKRIIIGKFYNLDVSKIEDWVLPVYRYG